MTTYIYGNPRGYAIKAGYCKQPDEANIMTSNLKICPRCRKHTTPRVRENNGSADTFYRCEYCQWKMGKVTE